MCRNCAAGRAEGVAHIGKVLFHCIVFLNRILTKGAGEVTYFEILLIGERGVPTGLSISILDEPTGSVGYKFLKPVWFECAFGG